MKSRTTIVLLFLAAVVGGLVLWDFKKGTTTDQRLEKGNRLVTFQRADVTVVELVHTNQTIVLQKTNDLWNVTQPLAVRADAGTVNSILDELEFADRERTLADKDLKGVNLADFGLTTPRLRATLRTKTTPITLLLGNETPTKDAIYVQLLGAKQVATVRKNIFDRLNTSLDNLRSRTAIEFTPASTTRFELKSADRAIEVAKTALTTNTESRWMITQPVNARADQRKVTDLLNDVSGLRIDDFISEDPKDLHTYQLDEPQRQVTVWQGEAGKTLLIGRAPTNDAAKVYAKLKSADSIFTVSSTTVARFAVQINDLRDTHVLAFNKDDVRGIELLRGTSLVALKKDAKGWQVTAPASFNAEEDQVTDLLQKLSDLSVKQFAADVATDLDKYGLAAPALTVTLQGQGTNVLAQLLIGGATATDGVRYAKCASEPFIYAVETNIVTQVPATALALRTRRVAELKPEDVTKITVQKGATQTILERDAQKKWKLVTPAQGVLDTDGLQRLIENLTDLHAQDFVREGRDNLATYGLDTPDLTVTFQAADKPYTLALGKSPKAEERYASWSDPALIFTLPRWTADTISKDLVTTPTTSTNKPPATAAKP